MAKYILSRKTLSCFVTILYFVFQARAVSSLDTSDAALKYQIISLSQVCSVDGGDKEPLKMTLTSVGPKSALMLLVAEPGKQPSGPSQLSPDCHISFQAPERHFLAISYLVAKQGTRSAARTYCPFNLTVRNDLVGESNNLCKPENTSPMLPNLYPRRLTLDIKSLEDSGWPSSLHSLIITSVGTDSSVCYDANQFPCDWERKYNGAWGDLQPKLCISIHLACDGVINCPLSGADEISALCHSNRNSQQLGEKFEDKSKNKMDISKRIQSTAEEAAANLVLRRHKSHFNFTKVGQNQQQDEDQNIEDNKSSNMIMTALYCLCGFVMISAAIFLLVYFSRTNHRTCTSRSHSNEVPQESIELGVTPSAPESPVISVVTSEIEQIEPAPPAYATLFPSSIKGTNKT